MKTKLKIKAILYHGATLSTSDLRRAGVSSTSQLPKPEQYHPEFIVEQNGKRYIVSAKDHAWLRTDAVLHHLE